MDLPLVSVVIATNRGGPFLDEALASVCSQDYPNLECVLVDDGSEIPEDIQEIVGRHPTVVSVRQRNAGSSVARNNGVRHTSGKYIAFLDDDDRWHPERISLHVRLMESSPASTLSYCKMRVIDELGAEMPSPTQTRARDVHDVLRRRTGIIAPNIVITRECFERVGGFHPAFRRAQDLDLVIKAAMDGDVTFVDRTLVDYRAHSGNNTKNYRELCRSIDRIVRLHRWAAKERGFEDIVDDHTASLRANKRFAAWSAMRSARGALGRGDHTHAASDLLWGLSFAPLAPADAALRRARRRDVS